MKHISHFIKKKRIILGILILAVFLSDVPQTNAQVANNLSSGAVMVQGALKNSNYCSGCSNFSGTYAVTKTRIVNNSETCLTGTILGSAFQTSTQIPAVIKDLTNFYYEPITYFGGSNLTLPDGVYKACWTSSEYGQDYNNGYYYMTFLKSGSTVTAYTAPVFTNKIELQSPINNVSLPFALDLKYNNNGFYDQMGIDLFYENEIGQVVNEFFWVSITPETGNDILKTIPLPGLEYDKAYQVIISLNESTGSNYFETDYIPFQTLNNTFSQNQRTGYIEIYSPNQNETIDVSSSPTVTFSYSYENPLAIYDELHFFLKENIGVATPIIKLTTLSTSSNGLATFTHDVLNNKQYSWYIDLFDTDTNKYLSQDKNTPLFNQELTFNTGFIINGVNDNVQEFGAGFSYSWTDRPCSLTQIVGCVKNASAWLLIPSPDTLQSFLDIDFAQYIPFGYLNHVKVFFKTLISPVPAEQMPDIGIDAFGGRLTFFSQETFSDFPGRDFFSKIMRLGVIISFFLYCYRRILSFTNSTEVKA